VHHPNLDVLVVARCHASVLPVVWRRSPLLPDGIMAV